VVLSQRFSQHLSQHLSQRRSQRPSQHLGKHLSQCGRPSSRQASMILSRLGSDRYAVTKFVGLEDARLSLFTNDGHRRKKARTRRALMK
jgi:hypothetical protein